MTDWSGLSIGVDVSHYQERPDWDRLQAAGVAYALIKCAESGAVDAQFDYNRKALADRNIPWLPYAFLRPGDSDATINAYCDAVGATGIPAALDWEARNVSSAVVERWIDVTRSRFGRGPLVYYGLFPPAPLTLAIRQCPRWLPEYPNSPTADPKIPPWDGQSPVPDWSRRWFIWQWTQSGSLPGIAGHVDSNRLSCPLGVFQEWYRTGNLPAAPAPTPAPPAPAPAGSLAITETLQLHATGDEVVVLQRRLQQLGFPVSSDGIFGPVTEDAVMAFQTAHGLPADGVVGPLTRNALAG
jgi:GH25 family lysozyme M1 (1,4-beta-N-acetylmuramidase)